MELVRFADINILNALQPGPVPGVRPPMGGAGHVVHPQQKGLNSMGVIMPIYTIGIVIFFSYTLMKVITFIIIHHHFKSSIISYFPAVI